MNNSRNVFKINPEKLNTLEPPYTKNISGYRLRAFDSLSKNMRDILNEYSPEETGYIVKYYPGLFISGDYKNIRKILENRVRVAERI